MPTPSSSACETSPAQALPRPSHLRLPRAQVELPPMGLNQLLLDWSRGDPTFFLEFDSDHGNPGHATAAEIASELMTFTTENEEGVVYDVAAVTSAAVQQQLERLLREPREGGASHGVSRRSG